MTQHLILRNALMVNWLFVHLAVMSPDCCNLEWEILLCDDFNFEEYSNLRSGMVYTFEHHSPVSTKTKAANFHPFKALGLSWLRSNMMRLNVMQPSRYRHSFTPSRCHLILAAPSEHPSYWQSDIEIESKPISQMDTFNLSACAWTGSSSSNNKIARHLIDCTISECWWTNTSDGRAKWLMV